VRSSQTGLDRPATAPAGEIGDECVNLDARVTLTTGSFDLQGLWSNSASKCVTHS
jgi:hypothetical protein